MKSILALVLITSALAFVSGCATTKPAAQFTLLTKDDLDSGESLLVFLRTDEHNLYLLRRAPIEIDNKKQGEVAKGEVDSLVVVVDRLGQVDDWNSSCIFRQAVLKQLELVGGL